MISYPITPRGAVRLSRQDRFAPSKAANAYFRYGADIRTMRVTLPERPAIIFRMPMPKSWSKKKRDAMRSQPCLSRPDKDNLEKGLVDSIYYGRDDAHVWCSWTEKRWADVGAIEVYDVSVAGVMDQILKGMPIL